MLHCRANEEHVEQPHASLPVSLKEAGWSKSTVLEAFDLEAFFWVLIQTFLDKRQDVVDPFFGFNFLDLTIVGTCCFQLISGVKVPSLPDGATSEASLVKTHTSMWCRIRRGRCQCVWPRLGFSGLWESRKLPWKSLQNLSGPVSSRAATASSCHSSHRSGPAEFHRGSGWIWPKLGWNFQGKITAAVVLSSTWWGGARFYESLESSSPSFILDGMLERISEVRRYAKKIARQKVHTYARLEKNQRRPDFSWSGSDHPEHCWSCFLRLKQSHFSWCKLTWPGLRWHLTNLFDMVHWNVSRYPKVKLQLLQRPRSS